MEFAMESAHMGQAHFNPRSRQYRGGAHVGRRRIVASTEAPRETIIPTTPQVGEKVRDASGAVVGVQMTRPKPGTVFELSDRRYLVSRDGSLRRGVK